MALMDGLIVGCSILGFMILCCLICQCCFSTQPAQNPPRKRSEVFIHAPRYTRGIIAADITLLDGDDAPA